MASDQVKLGISGGKIMVTSGIARMQARTTGGIVQIQVMQAVRHLGCLGQAE